MTNRMTQPTEFKPGEAEHNRRVFEAVAGERFLGSVFEAVRQPSQPPFWFDGRAMSGAEVLELVRDIDTAAILSDADAVDVVAEVLAAAFRESRIRTF
jgi:hypothetical protein